MKLIQLNVWGGRLEYAISDALEKEKPDILCLQEAIAYDSRGSGLFITIEALQEKLDLPYLAFEPVFSFNFMNGKAHFGNAILSRFPIQKTKSVFTHLEYKPDFIWGEHSSNIRNLVHAVIDIQGKAYNVLTHHGFWVKEHKDGNGETSAQMELIQQYIASLEGPVILTGDFNLKPTSESLEGLNKTLKNLSIEHALKTTRNSLTYKTEVCDYIFINDNVIEKKFYTLSDIISDHQALVLEFDT